MNSFKKTAVIFSLVGLAAGTAGTIALQTQASNTTTGTFGMRGRMMQQKTNLAAAGIVSAISGNSITLKDNRTGTVYTVDANSAVLEKFVTTTGNTKPSLTTITIADIKVGDHIQVQGTVSGTGIVATKITDGQMGKGIGMHGRGQRNTHGTVSAINGKTITLTGIDGKTYTVEAGNASVRKVSQSSVSNIAVGDTLMVSGEKSGATITAQNIMNGELPLNPWNK